MTNLERSDAMLLNNHAYLQYKDMKTNDMLFRQQFSSAQPRCLKEIELENRVNLSSRIPSCDQSIISRGGNNRNCPGITKCPNIYSAHSLNEFLIIPCSKNTYKNYLVTDGKKVCTKSHQVLNNWTRRKDITYES